MKHQYRKIVLVTLSPIVLLGLSILTIDFDQFGAIPSGQDLTRVRKSEAPFPKDLPGAVKRKSLPNVTGACLF